MIRAERADDILEIHKVHAASFPTIEEALLVDRLRAAGRLSVSLVAQVGESIVGHVAFSPVSSATGAVGAGLGPIAVADSHRRQGIASGMVRAGLDACREPRLGWVVVLGEPAFYSRFGFRPASEFGLSDEFGGGAAFQAIELIPGAMPTGAGLVRYAPEFASLG
jgi:putative acetyltransferase